MSEAYEKLYVKLFKRRRTLKDESEKSKKS